MPTYLDIYPECGGCPHYRYCGTMVGSIRLCNSYSGKEYGLYNRYGQLEKKGFQSESAANKFRISRQRYDWEIKEIV